jgi:PEP-CTERM motif
MGHLFYQELGGVADTSIATTHNANYNLFTNFVTGLSWSATAAPGNALAFIFDFGQFNGGAQYPFNQGFGLPGALAVHAGAVGPGDGGGPGVPEPATMLLVGLGLAGLGWMRQRRTSKIR